MYTHKEKEKNSERDRRVPFRRSKPAAFDVRISRREDGETDLGGWTGELHTPSCCPLVRRSALDRCCAGANRSSPSSLSPRPLTSARGGGSSWPARGISSPAEEMRAPSAAAAIRLGPPPPYLRTHGAKVARRHLADWIVLLLLAAADAGLNLIEPFHRFVHKDMLDSLLYPLHDNTVPVWAVPIVAVAGPMLIFVAFYVRRKNAYDLHHAILGLLFSVLITGVLTDAIKDGVGRPRPNFFWRCLPDGVLRYNNFTGQLNCNGDAAVIKEGHKSFPSGHTSWSFAGLGFLSWYLAGKIRAFDQHGHVYKLCIVILPLLLAAMVGVSRVADYWHHWQDVFAGGILGLVVASFCYLQFFPNPAGEHGHWPHAYHLHILNPETETQAQPTASDRHQSVLPHDLSVVPYAVSMEMRTNGRALDSMEAGSRAR